MAIIRRSAMFDFSHDVSSYDTTLLGSVNVLETFGVAQNKSAIYTTSFQVWIFKYAPSSPLDSLYGAYLASNIYGFQHDFQESSPGTESLISIQTSDLVSDTPEDDLQEILGTKEYLAYNPSVVANGWNIEYYLDLDGNTKSRVAVEIKMIGDGDP